MKRVYFIKPIGMDGPIKIGCSMTPDTRRQQLATWSPFPLEIVAEIDGGEVLERRFHAAFVGYHQRREWFSAGPDLIATISEINAGTFDVDTLPGPMGIASRVGGVRRSLSDAHKADQSLSLRLAYMRARTGCQCTVNPFRAHRKDDILIIHAAEAYLADPLRWGRQIDHEWAHEARAKYASQAAS